jgi:hypothetical protein
MPTESMIPAFQRTRENGSEFGRAGTAGKL